VERAKVYLIRLDPKALLPSDDRPLPGATAVSWLKVRIFEKGRAEPEVSVNLPVGLAELVFKSLPDDAKRELGRRGYGEGNFWERIHKLGPTKIIDIDNGDGGRVQIWTE
jgi:hypothetical protein